LCHILKKNRTLQSNSFSAWKRQFYLPETLTFNEGGEAKQKLDQLHYVFDKSKVHYLNVAHQILHTLKFSYPFSHFCLIIFLCPLCRWNWSGLPFSSIHPLCIAYIFIFSLGLMASAIQYSYVSTTICFEKTIYALFASASG
jgi:hypothetical protein